MPKIHKEFRDLEIFKRFSPYAIVRRGCNGKRGGGRPHYKREYDANFRGGVGLSRNKFLFKNINNIERVDMRYIRRIECELKEMVKSMMKNL